MLLQHIVPNAQGCVVHSLVMPPNNQLWFVLNPHDVVSLDAYIPHELSQRHPSTVLPK
uniref:Uncharacterized protein n=1 Tax=Meloidogyne incognita TaxID=6306 RepID=A0A914ML75_MELIC